MPLETVLDGLAFPECPRWHDESLYFSDMHDGKVWRIAPSGKAENIYDVPEFPAGLGWLPDGTLQIVSMKDRRVLRATASGLAQFADLSRIATGNTNDMVVDREGRAYVGNFGFDLNAGAEPAPTVLIAVEPDGSARAVAEDMWFPNGMVITPDGKTLIVAETFAGRLTAFDIGAGGSLANRRVWAPVEGIFSDGICLDADGGVWVASADGHSTIRVVEGGKRTHEIEHAGRHSYACMLGGADRRDLYLCTAENHLPQKTVVARSGKIERVRVDVAGAGLP
ncbi:MAG: SMP-30/gluconolactonase/LRE family protein [Acidobacteriia bacterium]|nr:SMP-30/gluconolactonase/LRE family protein [Terriglobia bacterium]